jgi:hypothetical protein
MRPNGLLPAAYFGGADGAIRGGGNARSRLDPGRSIVASMSNLLVEMIIGLRHRPVI